MTTINRTPGATTFAPQLPQTRSAAQDIPAAAAPESQQPTMTGDENTMTAQPGTSEMKLEDPASGVSVSISVSVSINGKPMTGGEKPQGAQEPGKAPGEQPGQAPGGAEDPQGAGPKDGAKKGAEGIEELFKSLDGDGDGKLSLEELIKGLQKALEGDKAQGEKPIEDVKEEEPALPNADSPEEFQNGF